MKKRMAQKHPLLTDKYTRDEGIIILSGVQALVRIPIDQHKADQRAGLKTATFISGYRGSPVGGLDFLLQQNAAMLQAHHIHFEPGINEDLAATAVFGSQSTHFYPVPRYDGVVGMWYGKGPGVDRSGDIFRHANFMGVDKNGGVLAVAGDDPFCKSSTIPSASEGAMFDANMPMLYPGTVQEVIEMGRLGIELSRYSGLWAGLKLVTNVADGYASAQVSPLTGLELPEWSFDGTPWSHTQNPALLAPHSLHLEREIYEGRLTAVRHFAHANKLNRIVVSSRDDWIGLVAAGKTYYDLREALGSVGLHDRELRRHGIRLLKLGMICPLDAHVVKQFAQDLEEIVVVEEKRGFIELQLRDLLYNETVRPRIVGKRDEAGKQLVKAHGELTPDDIVRVLAARITPRIPEAPFARRLALLQTPHSGLVSTEPSPPLNRTPYFCSGCPHNRSTKIPEGAVAGGGIGCHGMALLMPDRRTTGITHMGGEGVPWVGAAPFSQTKHVFQNLGDGTLFHSGYLAIRQAIAAKVNITYKILYNGTVAMTGGQRADGAMPVPALTQALHAEGVSKIVVVAADPDAYGDAQFAPSTAIWHRDRLDDAQEMLRNVTGVSILIYDQACATELRRRRKRGIVKEPEEHLFINEAVCEGCGDCGEKSNCLSVFPVETEFGRKTQIHQSSCNKDYTCLQGNCPAFIKVIPAENSTANGACATASSNNHESVGSLPLSAPSAPRHSPPDSANVYMTGIGGTGVVTITQILATAAHLDGKHVTSLDQTGLSQKGGPVVSHLKIMAEPKPVSNLIAAGEADVMLIFDLLSGATDANLTRAQPERTTAVISSSFVPTGSMVRNPAVHYPTYEQLRSRVDAVSRAQKNIYLDAIMLSEHLFGGHMQANMIVVGAAYQAGLLPVTEESILHAVEINGVAVDYNMQAFTVGRTLVADPEWLSSLPMTRFGSQEEQTAHLQVNQIQSSSEISSRARQLVDSVGAEGELHRLLEIRIPELIAYQNLRYASRYTEFVRRVHEAEPAGQSRLSEAVARYLYKLMAYKDEYEVARLHLRGELDRAIVRQFGRGAQVTYQLQPPVLKAWGLQRKISFGVWFRPVLRLLTWLRCLRGTPLDIFGYDSVRQVERALIHEYQAQIQGFLSKLDDSPENYEQAVKLATLPDMIRGYDEVKLRRVEKFREALERI